MIPFLRQRSWGGIYTNSTYSQISLRRFSSQWICQGYATDNTNGLMSLRSTQTMKVEACRCILLGAPFPCSGNRSNQSAYRCLFPSRGRNWAGNEYLLQFTSWPKNYVGGCGCQPVYQCLDIPLRKAGCYRQAIGGGFCGEKSQSRIPQRPGNAPSNADTLRYSQTMLASLIVSRLGSATIRSRVSRSTVT